MDARLDQLLSQLDCIEQPEPSEAPLDAKAIEQQWGQEIRTLKQELHQTILAHNHNADLIKHHKDTIDSLRERCMKLAGNSMKTSEIQQQLQHLDTRLKQQHKQRKLEPLFERLTALEQRVAAAAQNPWRYSAMMPGLGAAGMMAGGKGGMKGGAAAGAGANAMNPNLVAATAAASAAAAGGGAVQSGQKANDKAAFKCPTDEEVQARLSKLSVAAKAAPSSVASDDAAPALIETLAVARLAPELGGGPPGLELEVAAPKEPEEAA